MKCVKCKKDKAVENFWRKNNGKCNKTCNDCIDAVMLKYDQSDESGLCNACKKVKPRDGKKTCQKCINKKCKSQQVKRDDAKKMGLCITCYKTLPENGYSKCVKCRRRDKLSIVTKLFRNAKSRAKKSNLEFSITENDIIVPEYCPILGMKLEENKRMSKSNSFSLDRIDSSKGYIKGNIQVISHRANQIKNDSTIEELEKLINYLRSIKS